MKELVEKMKQAGLLRSEINVSFEEKILPIIERFCEVIKFDFPKSGSYIESWETGQESLYVTLEDRFGETKQISIPFTAFLEPDKFLSELEERLRESAEKRKEKEDKIAYEKKLKEFERLRKELFESA